jgi:hypothetical protein
MFMGFPHGELLLCAGTAWRRGGRLSIRKQDSRPRHGKQGARPGAPARSAVVGGVNYRGAEPMGYSWETVSFFRHASAGLDVGLVVSIPLTQ